MSRTCGMWHALCDMQAARMRFYCACRYSASLLKVTACLVQKSWSIDTPFTGHASARGTCHMHTRMPHAACIASMYMHLFACNILKLFVCVRACFRSILRACVPSAVLLCVCAAVRARVCAHARVCVCVRARVRVPLCARACARAAVCACLLLCVPLLCCC